MSERETIESQWAAGLDALKRAIAVLGNQQAVADAVRVRQSAVSECVRNGQKVPAEWCIPIEAATRAAGTEIPRADLRPDLFGPHVQPDLHLQPPPIASAATDGGARAPRPVKREASFSRKVGT